MAEQDDGGDKSHDASPERLRKARQAGNVPQSPELLTLARFTGVLIGIGALGGLLAQGLAGEMLTFLDQPDWAAAYLMQGGAFQDAFGRTSIGFFIVFGLSAVLAIVVLIAQQAITFAPKKLMPSLDRLSPLKNAKHKFGPQGMVEFLRGLIKMVIVMAVGVGIAMSSLPRMLGSVGAAPGLMLPEMQSIIITLLIASVILAAVASALDVPFRWAHHRQQLKMSLQELRQELREIEGDQTQKNARKQMARDIAQNRQLADVPKADVVVVNPEHYAVALRWNRKANEVPRCVAKGVDHMALRIRQIAEEEGVPVFRDVPTARALHATVEVGEEVRREHYQAVAAAIRFADKLRQRMKLTKQ